MAAQRDQGTAVRSPDTDGLLAWAERTGRRAAEAPGPRRAAVRVLRPGCDGGLQDPVTSRTRQYAQAEALVAGHGRIAAELFDIGQSRTTAWARRPQAAALVAWLADPGSDAAVMPVAARRTATGPGAEDEEARVPGRLEKCCGRITFGDEDPETGPRAAEDQGQDARVSHPVSGAAACGGRRAAPGPSAGSSMPSGLAGLRSPAAWHQGASPARSAPALPALVVPAAQA
jgi:hypothetical protein